MTRKEATEGLLARLKDPMQTRGFALLKTKAMFQKSQEEFTEIISFTVLDRAGQATEFRPQAALRSEEIEALASKGRPQTSITLGEEIGRIAGDPHRWKTTIQTAGDFENAAGLVLQGVDEIAEPFFKKFSDLHAIDEHINGNPRENAAFCRAQVKRAEVGVVVAGLLRRPDIEALTESYRAELGAMSSGYLKEFDEFQTRLVKS